MFLTSLAAPFSSGSPTRPEWRPLSQRSILLIIRSLISQALQTTNVLVNIMLVNTRYLLEFHLLLITPYHSVARIAVNWRPTAPVCVAYQLDDCAANFFQ